MKKLAGYLKKIALHKWSKRLYAGIVLFAITCLACDGWVRSSAKNQLYSDIHVLPNNETGLVLGTVKDATGGRRNLFFDYRIQAAAELFKAGKIKHIIVSGDNHVKGYDEPTDMRDALMALGVPAKCITMDYAGFRTFDSVLRCYKVFGQKKFTIISQQFHNERALFIANKTAGIEAVAYNAKEVPFTFHPYTFVREYLARVKCVMDIYVLHTTPRFLGKPELIAVN